MSGLTITLSVREIVANDRKVVAKHLDNDEYPIRVRLTRPLTDHERQLAEDHAGWFLTGENDEIVLKGRLDVFDETKIAVLVREVRQLQQAGRALDEQDEQRSERERLEHLAQIERVNELNRIVERLRYS